jgi:hypothetical protein
MRSCDGNCKCVVVLYIVRTSFGIFALLTPKIAQFREDFNFVVVRVEIFGGESLAAPWALPAMPLQHPQPGGPGVFLYRHYGVAPCEGLQDGPPIRPRATP